MSNGGDEEFVDVQTGRRAEDQRAARVGVEVDALAEPDPEG